MLRENAKSSLLYFPLPLRREGRVRGEKTFGNGYKEHKNKKSSREVILGKEDR
jgi:hypothetical protein